jgi:UDP-N-acetylmuramoyl-tripeptide--D-alanyl-D-alanine ligase
VTAPRLDVAFVAATLATRLRQPVTPGPAADAEFARAVIESREARPRDLFVALPGERVDGHDFAAAAVAAGATGILASRDLADAPGLAAATVFHVDDTLAALQDLGAAWRGMLPIEIVGITGSVGKTTTKAIAAAILARAFRVQANPLNYNNEISVPLCLLELRPQTERAVIELGMYTTGEIARLCEWVRPRTGIVLNVGPTHLERAGSREAIARAKRELPEALPAHGTAVLNADDPIVLAMADHTPARVLTFGTAANAEVRGTEVEALGVEGFRFVLSHGAHSRRVHVRLPGSHLVSNVLASAAAGLAEGMTFDQVADAVDALEVPTRMRLLTLADGTRVIDDTYNAQPASMMAALDLLDQMPGRHVALLGDMLELGEVSRYEHERVGERAGEVLDALVTLGDEARVLGEVAMATGHGEVHHATSREEAGALLQALIRPGDAVLIKGSHALGLEEVVAELERERREEGHE